MSKPPGYRFGRPTRYKKEFCDLLVEHMKSGLSFDTFGAEINCSTEILYEWCRLHPDFLHAKKVGQDFCRHFWEKLGRDEIINNNGRGLNSAVWVFNMKNRFMWTDRQETTVSQETTITDQRKFKLVEPTE